LVCGADAGDRCSVIQPRFVVVRPLERERAFIRGLKAENQEFVEFGRSLIAQPALRRRRFLKRVQKSSLARRRKRPVTFIPNGVVGAVDADNSNTDWVTAPALELCDLVAKIVDNAINLLDHRFGKYFDLDADLYGRDRTPGNHISGINNGCLARNDLPEGSVATPGSHTPPLILHVQNAVFAVRYGVDQLC